MAKNTSVLGIYPDRTTVADAVSVLLKAGYRATDISVLLSDNQGSKDFAHERHTKALPGAAVGALAGALAGAALAWCIATQTLRVPGMDVLIAAGTLVSALAGAGAGGALGWIVGGLAGLFRTEYVAKRYAGRIRHGGILLSVHCDTPEWCERAGKTLKDTGARYISSAAESAADFGTTDRPTERAPVVLVERVITPAPPSTEFITPEIGK
jgi:hypothetical protein